MHDFIRYYSLIESNIDLNFYIKGKVSDKTIKSLIILEPSPVNSLTVKYDDADAKSELYQLLCVGDRPVATAQRIVETCRDEIELFRYNRIYAKTITTWSGQIEATEIQSDCVEHPQTCAFGAQLQPPYKLVTIKTSMDIYEIEGRWCSGRPLMISQKLYDLFNEYGITGLDYSPVNMALGSGIDYSAAKQYMIAHVKRRIYADARKVDPISWYCRKHSVIKSKNIYDLYIAEDELNELDFVEIGGIRTSTGLYNYPFIDRLVSTRALKLMLNAKIKGLLKRGVWIKQSYESVPTTARGISPLGLC